MIGDRLSVETFRVPSVVVPLTVLLFCALLTSAQAAESQGKTLLQQAEAHRLEGSSAVARGFYQQAIPLLGGKDLSRAYFGLAECELKSQMKLAMDHYREAIEADKGNVEALAGLAWAYRRLGIMEEAKSLYRKAQKKNRRYLPGYLGLAGVYRDLGLLDLAEKELRLALGFSPSDPEALEALAEILEGRGGLEEAGRLYKRLSVLAPTEIIYLRLAHIQMSLRQYEEARKIFRLCLTAFPKSLPAQMGLGYLSLKEGELRASERIFAQILEEHPKESSVWIMRALVLARLRQKELARAAFEKAAISSNPPMREIALQAMKTLR